VYTTEPEWRDYFRSTAAHSALLVDGESQAQPSGPFSWASRPAARLVEWRSTEAYDLAVGERRGHRRQVLFLKPWCWLVRDAVSGQDEREHELELRFQFAPGVVRRDGEWARGPAADGPGLLLRCLAMTPLLGEVHAGETAPPRGWYSSDYGRREPAPSLGWRTVARLPFVAITLLLPVEDVTAPPPTIAPILDAQGQPIGVLWEDAGTAVRFDDEGSWRR
jgi:hypothetical protein